MSARACRSCSNRATTSRVSMPSLITVSATSRRTGRCCTARNTLPNPPSPSSSSSRYAPTWLPGRSPKPRCSAADSRALPAVALPPRPSPFSRSWAAKSENTSSSSAMSPAQRSSTSELRAPSSTSMASANTALTWVQLIGRCCLRSVTYFYRRSPPHKLATTQARHRTSSPPPLHLHILSPRPLTLQVPPKPRPSQYPVAPHRAV